MRNSRENIDFLCLAALTLSGTTIFLDEKWGKILLPLSALMMMVVAVFSVKHVLWYRRRLSNKKIRCVFFEAAFDLFLSVLWLIAYVYFVLGCGKFTLFGLEFRWQHTL